MMFEFHGVVNGRRVYVDKVGGGTLGRAYEGDWIVTLPGVYLEETLHTGTPKTHEEVAAMAIEFAESEDA